MGKRTNNLQAGKQHLYFKWLCDQVKVGKSDRGRLKLLKFLYENIFHGGIPNDQNRGEDGKEIRQRFEYEEVSYYFLEKEREAPCTILEMLLALAYRMDYILGDIGSKENPSQWFWKIVENLDLERYTWNPEKDEDVRFKNEGILEIFIDRTYSYSGQGGLFPLKNPRRDQRKVEIWYQMMSYIDENY